ncbi:MurR/RpiR family transcriptional regulator [bacterium]|nr:MurR/RpiR family transcriptional regulator [bacterium]
MQEIIESIHDILPKLKNAERRVAEYVLKHTETVTDLTITELAERAETSDPTVIRFCRKIGLKGYTDLRISLARSFPPVSQEREAVNHKDSSVNILHKMFQTNIEALNSFMSSLDRKLFDEAVEMIAEAKKISFFAFGGSGNVARDGHHKFFRLGLPCEVHTDAHMQFMSASLLDQKSVVIVISLKGSTKDLIESVNIARDSGARVIGIIGSSKSPLGKVCDLVIPVDVSEIASSVFPMATRLIQLAVLDVIYVSVTMKKWPSAKGNLEKVRNTLSLRNF